LAQCQDNIEYKQSVNLLTCVTETLCHCNTDFIWWKL